MGTLHDALSMEAFKAGSVRTTVTTVLPFETIAPAVDVVNEGVNALYPKSNKPWLNKKLPVHCTVMPGGRVGITPLPLHDRGLFSCA